MYGFSYVYVCVAWGGPVLTKFLSMIEKQLILFVASDKIRACRLKLGFWKTCVCYCERDNFPVPKNFCYVVGGDIN